MINGRTDLDGERGVGGGVPDIARGDDVEGEPDGRTVHRGDDRIRAAFGSAYRVLEQQHELARLQGAARRLGMECVHLRHCGNCAVTID